MKNLALPRSTPASPRRMQHGFTLVEMVVVVAIVGILAAAAMPVAELSLRRTREHALQQSLRTLREAIDAYKRAADEKRITVESNASGYPPRLEVLVDGVPEAQSDGEKRIYFLRRLPRDPFSDPAVPAAQSWGLRSYDSPPNAPAAGRDVFDVYSLSPQVALDGTPLRQW